MSWKLSDYGAVARAVFTRAWLAVFAIWGLVGSYDTFGSQILDSDLPKVREVFPLMPPLWWLIGLLLLLFLATFQHAVNLHAAQRNDPTPTIQARADQVTELLDKGQKLLRVAGPSQNALAWLAAYNKWTGEAEGFLRSVSPRAIVIFDNLERLSGDYLGVHPELQDAYSILHKRCGNLRVILDKPEHYLSPRSATISSTLQT